MPATSYHKKVGELLGEGNKPNFEKETGDGEYMKICEMRRKESDVRREFYGESKEGAEINTAIKNKLDSMYGSASTIAQPIIRK